MAVSARKLTVLFRVVTVENVTFGASSADQSARGDRHIAGVAAEPVSYPKQNRTMGRVFAVFALAVIFIPQASRAGAAQDDPPWCSSESRATWANETAAYRHYWIDYCARLDASHPPANAREAYLQRWQYELRRNTQYLAQQGDSGKVIVTATIGADGRVTKTKLVASSGDSRLDNLTIDAIRQINIGAPPGGGLTVNVPVVFVPVIQGQK